MAEGHDTPQAPGHRKLLGLVLSFNYHQDLSRTCRTQYPLELEHKM